MKTAFSLTDAEVDDEERRFLASIKEHGWFGTCVFGPESSLPDFSFSTGFWAGYQAPELILFGLERNVAHDILWSAFHDAQNRWPYSVGVRSSGLFGNMDAYLFHVARRHYAEYLGWSNWFYRGDDFPCLQLIWPDGSGLFPWEAGFAVEFESIQPDLTENGWRGELQD